MAVSQDILEEMRSTEGEDLDLSWLEAPAAERGLRIAPGKRGLTLEEIATGSYGDIPAMSRNQSGRMRGAAPRADAQNIADSTGRIRSASWSESAMLLYEEAVQRQWSQRDRHPVGGAAGAVRRSRARDVAALHVPHAGRVHRRRRAGTVRAERQR